MTNEEKAREIANQSPVYFMHIYNGCLEMAKWKDKQYNEEKKELISLVNMLPVDDHNQTIIEDLIALLR